MKGESKFRKYRDSESEEDEFDSQTDTECSDEEFLDLIRKNRQHVSISKKKTFGVRKDRDFMIERSKKGVSKPVTKQVGKPDAKAESEEAVLEYDKEFEFDKKHQKFKCLTCNKMYKNQDTVKSHRRIECSNKCIFCPYTGQTATLVRYHIGKKHGKWPKLDSSGVWIY
uniref:C2H2-type domain-containing protein n=1 Tax=Graphocephala atropunctata TaxID=36148 RepID=A0A1B6L8C1_9HEMI